MKRTQLAKLVSKACIGLFGTCLVAQLLTCAGMAPPLIVFAILFFTTFVFSGVIGLLQIRVEMIEREWPLFTYESFRTLFRRFPPWVGLVAIAMFVWHAIAISRGQGYPFLAGMLAMEFGALQSLQRQPWLLENLICPDGHPISYYNRFCPTCGASLPRIPGSA